MEARDNTIGCIGVIKRDKGPYLIRIAGRPFEPLPLGNLAYYYLRIPAADAVTADPAAVFLAYRSGRFVDVSADVRARRVTPRFFDNRP